MQITSNWQHTRQIAAVEKGRELGGKTLLTEYIKPYQKIYSVRWPVSYVGMYSAALYMLQWLQANGYKSPELVSMSDATYIIYELQAAILPSSSDVTRQSGAHNRKGKERITKQWQTQETRWCRKFSQFAAREIADKQLYDLIRDRRIAHTGNDEVAQHLRNASAKIAKDEDTKLRIIKQSSSTKIDLAVALSMASSECLRLALQIIL